MYAKYVTITSATVAEVMSDIAALCSGAALATLSASCDQAASTQVSAVAPGWTLIDTIVSQEGRVLSAPDADGLTTKYARLYYSTNLTADVYEYWNVTTHVGTNAISASTTNMGISLTAVNIFYIFATPRSIVVATPLYMLAALETSRDIQYLQGAAYPVLVAGTSYTMQPGNGAGQASYGLAMPRGKALTASGDVTGSTVYPCLGAIAVKAGGAGVLGPLTTTVQTVGDEAYHEVRALWLMRQPPSTSPLYGVVMGKLYDILETTRNIGVAGDTMTISGETWVLLPSRDTYQTFLMKAA